MKINISRIFETSKALAGEAGQQLFEFITYSVSAFEQIIRALKNGLNFSDNFDCDVVTLEVTHDTATTVYTDNKTPTGVLCTRAFTSEGIESFAWYIADNGTTQVKVAFTNAPTDAIAINLTLFYS